MSAQVMIVQLPAGVHNERLLNRRLADVTKGGGRARAMRDHNGLLVFALDDDAEVEQKMVVIPPTEQFEQPINERLAVEESDGWNLLAMESHAGFLVLLLER